MTDEIRLGEADDIIAIGKDRLAPLQRRQFQRLPQQRAERVGRPARGEIEDPARGRFGVGRTLDDLAYRRDATAEMPLGRRDGLIGDPLDRAARFSKADMPMRYGFFLSRAAEKAGSPRAISSASVPAGLAKLWRAATRASMVRSESWSVISKLTI